MRKSHVLVLHLGVRAHLVVHCLKVRWMPVVAPLAFAGVGYIRGLSWALLSLDLLPAAASLGLFQQQHNGGRVPTHTHTHRELMNFHVGGWGRWNTVWVFEHWILIHKKMEFCYLSAHTHTEASPCYIPPLSQAGPSLPLGRMHGAFPHDLSTCKRARRNIPEDL